MYPPQGNSTFGDISANKIGIGVAPSYLLQIKGTSTTDLPTYSAEFLDSANWTGTGVATDWVGDFSTRFTHLVGNTATLAHDHAAVSTTKYQIAYTVTGRTAGTFVITFGGQTSAAISATGAWGPTTTGTGVLQITPTSDFDGAIGISVKSITAVSTAIASIVNSSNNTQIEVRCGNFSGTQPNVLLGNNAGSYTTTGYSNAAIGTTTFQYNTTGAYNTAVGYAALNANTTGSNNVAVGQSGLRGNISGTFNIAIGSESLRQVTTSIGNTAIGAVALYSLTSNSYNTGIGYYAGYNANQKADAANSMALGANTFTTRSNQVVIGDASVVETQLRTGVYIGSTSTTAHTQPTARLHIAAGSATASTAPIKLTSGSLMTATEDGTFEYDGTNLYFSIGATRRTITVT
jgi:hypothetical protein